MADCGAGCDPKKKVIFYDKNSTRTIRQKGNRSLIRILKEKESSDLKTIRHGFDTLLKHEFRGEGIIRIREIMEDDKYLYIHTDAICNGLEDGDVKTLFDYLLAQKNSIPESTIKSIALQIADMIHQFHDKKLAVRNLALDNLLIYFVEGLPKVRLVNYDYLKWSDVNVYVDLGCFLGEYLSPELIDSDPIYTRSVDIWMFGVILYTLFAQSHPFHGNNKVQVMTKVELLDFDRIINPEMSKEANELILNLMTKDTRRFTIDQVMKSEWFTSK